MNKLSICIPTYNRASYLAELLDTIVVQMDGNLEICISDNASNDSTSAIVASYQSKFPFVRYHRQSENVGFDRNLLSVMQIATGDYCWIIGDDDYALDGAIASIQQFLNQYPDIPGAFVNKRSYSFDMMNEIRQKSVAGGKLKNDSKVAGVAEIYQLFANYIGYISALVVKREYWQRIADEEHTKSFLQGYIHVYIIGRVINQYGQWGYIHHPCVGWRSDNDTIAAQQGQLARVRLDIYEYSHIAKSLFVGHKDWYKIFMSAIVDCYIKGHLIRLKLVAPRLCKKLLPDCIKMYYDLPSFWLKVFPLFFVPSPFFKILQFFYRHLIKKSFSRLQQKGA